MDAAADFRVPLPDGSGEPRRALDLTEDTSIITAVANDVGVEAIFQRQVIAHGRAGDAALALSTSGNSLNIIDALAEARRREMLTIAMVGYDGGQIAQNALADHVIVTRSQHIPRIQEAQASAYHVLRELVELAGGRWVSAAVRCLAPGGCASGSPGRSRASGSGRSSTAPRSSSASRATS